MRATRARWNVEFEAIGGGGREVGVTMTGKTGQARRRGWWTPWLPVLLGFLGLTSLTMLRLPSHLPAGGGAADGEAPPAIHAKPLSANPIAVAGNLSAAATPAPIFADVPATYWARDYIESLYRAGYVAGCATNPLQYCPDRMLNRAEGSVFVLRGAYGSIAGPPHPAPSTPTFGDVSPAYWGYGWIESLYSDGFTAGCSTSPRLYCPLQQHTRAEGSVFFLRTKNGSSYSPPSPNGIFADVSTSAWYAAWVEAAYHQGLLPACSTSPLRFCPDSPLSRAWAAYMMVQAKGGLPLPTPTPAAPTPTANPSAMFPVGAGYVDVIPHQLVRTASDRVFLFAGQPYASVLRVYWSNSPGLPNSAAAFSGSASVTTSAPPISVEAAYGGGAYIFVFVNQQNGDLRVYPFDTQAGVFASPTTLASGNPTVSGDYIGSSGASAMVDGNGVLQVAYWAPGNQIVHQAYGINTATGSLQVQGPSTRLDADGSANHPVIATAPDNSLTVAWISEAASPVLILSRTRSGAGAWGSVETVSTSLVWHSRSAGVNIDQGPSLLISPDGIRHLTYIEDYVPAGDYGRVHYATRSGTSWSDTTLAIWSHDPALAINAAGDLYIIGHGHPANATCTRMDDICTTRRTGSGTWGSPQVFATAPAGSSFDSSPSIKWSGASAGFVRPETIEFAFFSTPYNSPMVYYARFP
jgi:hypothetical protein